MALLTAELVEVLEPELAKAGQRAMAKPRGKSCLSAQADPARAVTEARQNMESDLFCNFAS